MCFSASCWIQGLFSRTHCLVFHVRSNCTYHISKCTVLQGSILPQITYVDKYCNIIYINIYKYNLFSDVFLKVFLSVRKTFLVLCMLSLDLCLFLYTTMSISANVLSSILSVMKPAFQVAVMGVRCARRKIDCDCEAF